MSKVDLIYIDRGNIRLKLHLEDGATCTLSQLFTGSNLSSLYKNLRPILSNFLALMAVIYKIVLLVLTLVELSKAVSTAKLNVPRVLLPYYVTTPVNFTLEVSGGGCYTWKSTRPEVAKIHMLDVNEKRECSTRAVITAVSRHANHQTSMVLAQDDGTGLILHCDVIVDAIESLEIVRTTGELFLDDAPEVIAVRAKDNNGDTFSSLDGLEFEWTIITDKTYDGEGDSVQVLRFIPFSKSKYEAPAAIKELEARDAQGYMVLVEGKKTGAAKISAKPKDVEFKAVRSDEITLVVVANLMLNPAHEVYLLLGGTIHYKVEVIRQGRAVEITMPSDQFYLEVKDPRILEMDPYSSNVTALAYGSTSIVLKDRNIKSKEPMRQPTSVIHVVAADHLGMTVKPYDNWLLELGRRYIILVSIFNDQSNDIHLSDNILVDVGLPEESFDMLYATQNGTFLVVVPMKVGNYNIQASLVSMHKGLFAEVTSERISMSQPVEICDPVRIWPSLVILPWDPMMKPTHNLVLKPTGGCSTTYVWSSENPDKVTVNQKGELTTFTAGAVNITAASSRNTYLYGITKIVVIPVVDLQIHPATFEIEIDKMARLPLAMFGMRGNLLSGSHEGDKVAFTDCRKLSLKVELSDPSKFEYVKDVDSPVVGGGCATLNFKARSVGYTRVIVTYYNGEKELKTSAVLASYKPLKVINPSTPLVMTLGSSHIVTFEGGPQPWILKPDSHFEIVNVVNQSVATVVDASTSECANKNWHMFEVTCLESGKATVELKVGNSPSTTLPKPAVSKTEVTITCSLPTTITLQPQVKRPNGTKSACNSETGRIPVQCYNNLLISVIMLDESGRKFDNISSLHIMWELSDPNLASLPHAERLSSKLMDPKCRRIVSDVFQTLILHSKEGPLQVKATVTGYFINNHPLSIQPEIATVLELELVGDAMVNPQKASVFNHPNFVQDISILKGSGHFQLLPETHQVAKLEYDRRSRTVHIYPLMDGQFTLTVVDQCLEAVVPATAVIRVTGIKTIEVHTMDKVELNKEIVAVVRLMDPAGECLSVQVAQLTKLRASVGSNIIAVTPDFEMSTEYCDATFIIQGTTLGHTTITFKADVKHSKDSDAVTLFSEAVPIQVFPPLRLQPCNLTLIKGAIFQVTSTGGPQPQTRIEFGLNDSAIGSVSGDGLVSALSLGNALLTVKAIGSDPVTGKQVIYSQDETDLHVVELRGIQIRAPLSRMKSGTVMLVYAVGMSDLETPFTFASTIPSLIYEWKSSDREIATVQPLYSDSGIQTAQQDTFVMRVVAKQPGHTTLTLTVKQSSKQQGEGQIAGNKKLTGVLEIKVFERLSLIKPNLSSGAILITPNTEFEIKSNRDLMTSVTYVDVDANMVKDTVKKDEGKKDKCITMTRPGLISSGARSCQTNIIITAHEDFGVNQSMSVLVEVKPVSYLVVSSPTTMRSEDEPLSHFPVGGAMTLLVTFHDSVGNRFDAADIPLSYRANRFDIVDIAPGPRNDTFTIKPFKAGQTIIRFSHAKNSRVETYVNVYAEEALSPHKVLAIAGDVICFQSPVLSSEGNRGIWKTDSPNILHINAHTGIAVANSIGSCFVYYEVANDLILKTEVVVKKIDKISVLAHSFRQVSNAWPNKVYDVPILLVGEKSDPSSNVVGKNCSDLSSLTGLEQNFPYRCQFAFTSMELEVHINDVFLVEQIFSLEKGQYTCRLTVVEASKTKPALSTIPTDIQLTVFIPQYGAQPAVRSSPITLLFLPVFIILVEELSVNTNHPYVNLPIAATEKVFQHLQIIPTDPNVLEVLADEEDKKLHNVRLFPVHLKERCWEPGEMTLSLEISLDFGDRVMSIPVRIKFYEQTSDQCSLPRRKLQNEGWIKLLTVAADRYQGYLVTILSVCGTGVAILLGYWVMFNQGMNAPAIVNPDAFATQQGTRSFLHDSSSVTSPQNPSPPGRTLLWTDNHTPHGASRFTPSSQPAPHTPYGRAPR